MEMQDSQTFRRAPLSPFAYWLPVGLGGASLVVIIVLTATTLHRLPASLQTPALTLRERFPGHFRTVAEQQRFEAELNKTTPASARVRINVTDVCDTSKCNLAFPNSSNYVPLTPARGTRYNACCISTSMYIFPSYMVDVTGTNRTISSFDGNRQYFFTEECRQAVNCDYCTCQSSNYLVTAVYDDGPDNYDIGFFSLKGCCKCYN